MDFLFLLLLSLAVPFILPIASWVSSRRTRSRVSDLEAVVAEQREAIERLSKRLTELKRESRAGEPGPSAPAPTPGPAAAPQPTVAAPRPPQPAVSVPAPSPAAPRAEPRPPAVPMASPPPVARPPAPPPRPPSPPVAPPPRAAEPTSPPPSRSFDWESVVGVKLFSAIAGIALVFAAVLFLRYSVQQGWLQPPVRVLIGVLVGVTLLVVCELKAARKYPFTANALDAAAIAILFSTFFAAHALWRLIPAGVTFGLLALVTAVAVLLSIRRESLFIAVLGLLGGFATPALLSTGENRPVPLFAYLLLLNVGLAWVAYRQTWPVLAVFTLVLTTIYQWGWVFRFLSQSDLPLAIGVFLLFPVASIVGLLLATRSAHEDSREHATFERTAMIAAALPLLFAAYLAAVPAYGARPDLLFGFLALVDVGLFAITIARRQGTLHAAGAMATVLVTAVWFSISYVSSFRTMLLGVLSGFVAFYLAAPRLAEWFSRPLSGAASRAMYAAPVLLFAFPILARIEPEYAAPWRLFLPLLALMVLCAWRAAATTEAFVYFIAAFFAVAAQAVWSAQHLTVDRLRTAVGLYATFGILNSAVPIVARRLGRTLRPDAAPGVMLLASLGLLYHLASGDIAPAALWALGLLLAILNAGVFIESAAARLPLVAVAGTVLSWAILAAWWSRAAASVGVLPSLAVVAALTLVTLAGYSWAFLNSRERVESRGLTGFANALHLSLVGHLFLFFVAVNRQWSLPPWPLFGTLALVTLATSAMALVTGAGTVHAAGIVASGVIVMAWTAYAAADPWPTVGVAASAAVSLLALSWIPVARRFGAITTAAAGAACALFLTELTVAVATMVTPGAPFAVILAAHLAAISALLAVTWTRRWPYVAAGAALLAWLGLTAWQGSRPLETEWRELLILAGALYALFTIYPLVVGPRAKTEREPWLVALLSAAMTFLAARAAFRAGRLDWMIGVVPVVQGIVTALLLRVLLRLEPPGARDMGRLASVAGAALSFVTVAIPLQLDHQWITIGWALEGAALAWLYRRIPHRGLLLASVGLLVIVFVRLALNPAVFEYEPRGAMRIFNWYLYTYLIAAAAFFLAAWWLSGTDDRVGDGLPRVSRLLPGCAVILLFLLLNIEIADYYATGPDITFRFGATVSQDLTYTIGWLVFGMLLLAGGIYSRVRAARVTAVSLIAVTTFKCFLYDLSSLEGLYRIGSFVGLAMSLALVSLALQKYVLAHPKDAT